MRISARDEGTAANEGATAHPVRRGVLLLAFFASLARVEVPRMNCPECGSQQIVDGVCTDCGAGSQPDPKPEASSDAAPRTNDPAVTAEPGTGKKRDRRGCFLGCLGTLGVILLVALIGAGWFFHWPEKIGLVASPAEKLFEASPNPWAAKALKAELSKQGRARQGRHLLRAAIGGFVRQLRVCPHRRQPGGEVDAEHAREVQERSRGLPGAHGNYEGGEGSTASNASRSTIATADNLQVAVLTAKTSVLRKYAAGKISQQALFDQMDVYADVSGFIGGMTE